METKNNLTTGILLGIGVIVLPLILMSSSSTTTSNNEMVYGTPESHVWELSVVKESETGERVYSLNKVTGEVRKFSRKGMNNGKLKDQYYQVLHENKEGDK